MRIIGRKDEQRRLEGIVQSGKPEFVVVYGRRRVGKTYLIGEYFKQSFAFRASGIADERRSIQLGGFSDSLKEYGSDHEDTPRNWMEAFSLLRTLLQSDEARRDPDTGRLVVFIDELPWLDTPKSDFRPALEHFWNAWGCTQEDLLFIVCGSATSWLVDNLLMDTKGFYNRVTRIIDLQPLDLHECREFLEWRQIPYTVRQVVEFYMVFGGIPYYLDLQERGLSLAQNIEALLFTSGGQLVPEFERLYHTLFRNPEPYVDVVRFLAKGRRSGSTRDEISEAVSFNGGTLTKVLRNLELCGFIRAYRNFTKPKNGKLYQLIDAFTRFHLMFVDGGRIDGWVDFVGSPAYHAWTGLAFEMVCLTHADFIKRDLGISGMHTSVCAWRSRDVDPGAQIDLLIDRRDDVVSLCEMKFSDGEYLMTADDERSIRNKMTAFRTETRTKKAIHPALVTLDGARHNAHFNSVILREVRVVDWL